MKVIILAGGSGTRLWPLSRNNYPKQFIKFNDEQLTLFQQAFKRSLLLANIEDIYVVTNNKYKFLVMRSLEELGYDYIESNILVEPEAKNTLPAIYTGVNYIIKSKNDSEDDSIVVFSSDHSILKEHDFINIILNSVALSQETIVTFGIKPSNPNTGYGYIEPGENKYNGYEVKSFKEKPNQDLAKLYIENGYYWNSGIFMFRVGLFVNEVKKYTPYIYSAFDNSRSIQEAFNKIDKGISIDYGIMEKSKNVSVVPADIGWNDLGSFDAIYEILNKNKSGSIINKDSIDIDSCNNYVYTNKDKIIALIGINDLIIVDNNDALLICKRNETQKVKVAVDILQERKDKHLESNQYEYNSWGYYKTLEEKQEYYRIRKIELFSGKEMKYQVPSNYNKQWIILNGKAKIIIDNDSYNLSIGDKIVINPGQYYEIYNIVDEILNIIEVEIRLY